MVDEETLQERHRKQLDRMLIYGLLANSGGALAVFQSLDKLQEFPDRIMEAAIVQLFLYVSGIMLGGVSLFTGSAVTTFEIDIAQHGTGSFFNTGFGTVIYYLFFWLKGGTLFASGLVFLSGTAYMMNSMVNSLAIES